jgi:APA family basic amino acid/polyamine antiporter
MTETTSGLHRAARIGVGSAAALVAGNMIGAGVFTTSGFALADLGSREAVLLAWLVGGSIALCGAWSYARLAEAMPGNGGEYLFLSRAVHPLAGFLAGWVSLLAGFTAPIAVAAHGLEAYALESFALDWPPGLLGGGAIVAAGLAHGVRRDSGLRLQNWAVSAQILAILGFIVLGSFGLPTSTDEAATTAPLVIPISAFAVTLVWISFSYSGWNAAIYVAGEIGGGLEAARRTLMRATLLGTLGVVALYVTLNAVFVYAAPVDVLAGRADIGAVAAEALAGPNARRILSLIVGLGLATSISAMVMVGPRIYAKMADDGVLPGILRSEGQLPRAAIILQVGLALIAFFVSGLRELLLYVGFLLSLSAAGTVACLFMPTIRAATRGRGSRALDALPLFFLVATLGSAGFMIFSEPAQALAGGATLVVGAAVYAIASRSAARRRGRGQGRGRGRG